MSKRTQELIARITGEVRDAQVKFELMKQQVTELGATGERANRQLANASTTATKAAAAQERQFGQNANALEKTAKGFAAVSQAAYALDATGSARVMAFGNAVGNLLEFLGPQGKLVSGAAIVGSTMVALFLQAKEKAREAREAMEEDLNRLINSGDFVAIKQELERIDKGTLARGYTDGLSGLKEKLAFLELQKKEIENGKRQFETVTAMLRESRGVNRELDATKAKIAELTVRYKALDDALKSPFAPRAAARGLEGAPIASRADTPEAIAQRAKDAAKEIERINETLREDLRKLKAESVEALRTGVRALEAENTELGKRLAFWLDQTEAEDAARDSREKTIAGIVAEIRAINEGAEAYKAFQEERERNEAGDAAVAEAKARALKEGKTLSAEQINDIRFQAEFAQGLAQSLAKAVQSLRDPAARDLAGTLAEVAENATQIATSLGEAGRGLAVIAGIAGPALRGIRELNQATQKRGPDGNTIELGKSVGFLDAIRGRNGKDSQTQAIAAGLSVVSSVAVLADAVDLFGVRARERARQLREAAIAFNRALEDFAITNRTQLESNLQDNLRKAEALVKQAGEKSELSLAGIDLKSIDQIELFAQGLRGLADEGDKVRKNFGPLADSLEEVARIARQNERELAAINAAEVRRLDEDLQVRRLALEVGQDAADEERARLELARNEEEIRKKLGAVAEDYLRSLNALVAAEQAAAAAAKERAAILQQLNDDNAILGGSASERLQRGVSAFVRSFVEEGFADALQGFDFSTEGGLRGARDVLKRIYQQLAADGISESERPIVEFIKSLIGDIDGALSDLPDVLEKLGPQLEAFNDRVQLFGTNVIAQLGELRAIFAGKFGETFDELLASADLTTDTGRAEFKNKIESALSGILADGVIDASERPLYEVLKTMLGIANKAIDDAVTEADRLAQEAAEEAERLESERQNQRTQRRTRAANRVQLFDLDGADAIRETLGGFGEAFDALFSAFDLETLQGVEGAKDVLRGVFASLDELSDEEIMQRFGMTRDELLAAILDVDSGFDGLVSALQSVEQQANAAAQAGRDFAESVNQDFLRATGRGADADRAGAMARRDKRLAQANEYGSPQSVLDQIEAIYQADLADIAKREAAAVVQAAATRGALQGALQGAVGGLVNTAASAAGTSPRTRTNQVVSDFASLSEVTAQTLTGVLRQIEFNTGDGGALVRALRGGMVGPSLSQMTFPAFPIASAGTTVILQIQQITVSVAPGGYTPEEAGQRVAASLGNALRDVRADVRYLGSARRG